MPDKGNKERHQQLGKQCYINCPLCPPNKGENTKRKPKHHPKPRKRNIRRGK